MYIQNKQEEELWGVNREGKRRKMYKLVFSSVNIPTNKTSAWFDLILAHTVKFPISLNCSFYQSITFTEHKLLVTNQLNLLFFVQTLAKRKPVFTYCYPIQHWLNNPINLVLVFFAQVKLQYVVIFAWINHEKTKAMEQSLKINNFSF